MPQIIAATRLSALTVLVLAGALLAGCQTGWTNAQDQARYAQPRSLATRGRVLSEIRSAEPTHGPSATAAYPARPWWTSRKDSGPQVIMGYRGPTIETTTIRSRDSRYVSGDRVHDQRREHIYRTKSTQTFR